MQGRVANHQAGTKPIDCQWMTVAGACKNNDQDVILLRPNMQRALNHVYISPSGLFSPSSKNPRNPTHHRPHRTYSPYSPTSRLLLKIIIRRLRRPRPRLHHILILTHNQILQHPRRSHPLAIIQPVHRHKNIKVPRQDQRGDCEDEAEMGEDEAEDVDGVVAEGPEFGVGETVDDEEDRGGDVADERAPEHGDVPVLAGAYDDIEVAAELVALVCG